MEELKKHPADLLVAFIKSVLNDHTHQYSSDIYQRVSNVISDAVCNLDDGIEARDRAIESAFNHDGAAKHGLLKSKIANGLIKELSAFIKSEDFRKEVVPVDPSRSGPSPSF